MSRSWMGIGVLFLVAGCWTVSQDTTSPAPEVRLDGNHALGAAVEADNLTVWPILADRVADVDAFLTLDEAQAEGAVFVREQENASVNTIVLENNGDQPVLICAGTLVVGGKQDRQIGEDVVVAAKTETSVPAYCVEQGRWSGDGDFRSINLIASKNVRKAGQYLLSQETVWSDVLTSSSYPTAIRTKTDQDLSRRRRRYEAIVGHLAKQDRARLVGLAHAVDGKPAGLRTFAHPKLLAGRLESLVASMCLDAEESLEKRRVLAFEEAHRETVAWLRLASWAYDRGEYVLAKRNAEHALALDPDNTAAKNIIRISDEIRYCSDADRARVKFNTEWRRIIKEIQVASLPAFVPPQITQVGVDEDNETPLFPSSYAVEGQSIWDRVVQLRTHRASLRFHDARDLIARPPPPSDKPTVDELIAAIRQNVEGADATDMVALFRNLNAAGETQRESSGTSRNSYRETEKGFQSTCRVRDKNGRWIPLTRDWTAK